MIGRPLRGFAASGDDHAGAIARAVLARSDGSGQVHDARDGADDTGAVMHQPHQFPHLRLPPEIEDAAQRGMRVIRRADLNEENTPAEMIDDGLPSFGRPPLDGAVAFSASDDDPIRHLEAKHFGDLRRPCAFQRVEVDVAAELGGADAQVEFAVQVFGEAVNGVIRRAVALLQQREIALDSFRLVVAQRGDPGIVQPQVIEGRADIREELAGTSAVQIAHSSGEQHNVAERIPAAQNEPAAGIAAQREVCG